MSMKAPINLRALIYRTAELRGEPDEIEIPFGDEFTVGDLKSSEIREEATRSAKVWMASAKYVAPAASVAMALSNTNEQSDKVLSALLESASSSAFASVVDAYSCGATFNDKNIFGLYRYSLSAASVSTSLLAFLTKKIIPEFSKMINSHIAEVATGVKPFSRRDMPTDTSSFIGNSDYRKNLSRYVNITYPDSQIGYSTQVATSIINTISRTLSNYQVRSKVMIENSRLENVISALLFDTMEKWIYHTQNTANGNVLSDVSDDTRVMVVQNALNLISAIANSAMERVASKDNQYLYSPKVVDTLSAENEKMIALVMKKTNAYASVFSRNEGRIFDAVKDNCLGYDRPLHTDITPNGWLKLFELPSTLIKYVAKDIRHSDVLSQIEVSSIVDEVLEPSLSASLDVLLAMGINDSESWAYKELVDAAMEFQGVIATDGLKRNPRDLEMIAKCGQSALDSVNGRLGTILNSYDSPSINPQHAIAVKYAGASFRLLSMFAGSKDSVHKFEAIDKLNKLSLNSAIECFLQLQRGNKSIDSQIMELGCLINAMNQIVTDVVRYQSSVNQSSSNYSCIKDVIDENALYTKICVAVENQASLLTSLASEGIDRLTALTLKNINEKKFEAAVTEARVAEPTAALVL